jgi:shikimate dehydrogenase
VAEIAGSTRLVGLIGNPVAESLSPRMQNAAFAARALDWAYVPLPVEGARLEEAVAGLVALGFAGANVTVPHKTAAVAFCDELDGVAERAGSVNTLVVREGRVHGSSTDGLAVAWAVEPDDRVLVLGAGGAAQAAASALLDAGVRVLAVSARRDDAANALLARLRTIFPDVELSASLDAPTAIVHATPVRDEVPVALDGVRTVVDLAYRPDGAETALAAAAREAGVETVVDGLEVLVRQGAASFECWTGVEAPVEIMRAAVRSAP